MLLDVGSIKPLGAAHRWPYALRYSDSYVFDWWWIENSAETGIGFSSFQLLHGPFLASNAKSLLPSFTLWLLFKCFPLLGKVSTSCRILQCLHQIWLSLLCMCTDMYTGARLQFGGCTRVWLHFLESISNSFVWIDHWFGLRMWWIPSFWFVDLFCWKWIVVYCWSWILGFANGYSRFRWNVKR